MSAVPCLAKNKCSFMGVERVLNGCFHSHPGIDWERESCNALFSIFLYSLHSFIQTISNIRSHA